MRLLAFGEVLWDIYPTQKYMGGATFNFAAHTVIHGDEAFLVSAVGDDDLGKETLLNVRQFGLKDDFVSIIQGKETGKCVVTLGENGIPSYNLLDDVAYDYIKEPQSGHYDLLYFGTLALRGSHNISAVKNIIDKKLCDSIFVDVNIRAPFYSGKSVLFALENADYIKISDEEMGVVTQIALGNVYDDGCKAVEELSKKFAGLKLIIFTMGEKGACVYDCVNKKFYSHSAAKVTVASTVGAGDSFGASFMSEFLGGKSIDDCLSLATRVSGYVVSCADAVPKYDVSKI